MENSLTILEEFDIERKIKFPHLEYTKISSISKRKVAYDILFRKNEDIILINPSGFKNASVLAGLNEKHVEYLMKNATLEYRIAMREAFSDGNIIEEMRSIARDMDDDVNMENRNQTRLSNICRYIYDNWNVILF